MSDNPIHADREFEEFYSRNYKLVYRICYIYMKNSFEAEDCTEDTFVKVLTGDFHFQDESHEKAWLTVTAMNLCKDKLKHWWRKNTVPLEQYEELGVETSFQTDETLEVIKQLPAKYKDVIYLYYYMGYPTEQIAQLLKKPASTVRNHLRDARRMLKDILSNE